MTDEQEQDSVEDSKKPRLSLLKRVRSVGLQIILMLIVVWGVDLWMTRNTVHASPPPIEQNTIANQQFSLEVLKGEPSLIHFWGTWCPICNVEQGTINSMGEDYPMVTIAMQSGSDDEITTYLHDNEVSYRVINDNSGIISKQYGVKTVPTTFVLDRDGEIRFVTQGYSSELGLRFKLWLASL